MMTILTHDTGQLYSKLALKSVDPNKVHYFSRFNINLEVNAKQPNITQLTIQESTSSNAPVSKWQLQT